jgi:DNA-binding NarL/FixJ family response regulator
MTNKTPVATKPNKKTVLLVDDHPMVRECLAHLINQQDDLAVTGEAESAPQAMQLLEASVVDLAIVDLSLNGPHGMELIKDIAARYPHVPVLVLSMHDESLFAERVLRAGARGYITKQEATEKVMVAIRRVLNGEIYLSDQMATKLLQRIMKPQAATPGSLLDVLSDRELEVYELIGRGLSTRQIAETMNLDVKTIETYRARVKEKLNLKDTVSLVQSAAHWVRDEGLPPER